MGQSYGVVPFYFLLPVLLNLKAGVELFNDYAYRNLKCS